MRAYACNCLQTTTKKSFRVHGNDKFARFLAIPVRKNTVIKPKKNWNIFKWAFSRIIYNFFQPETDSAYVRHFHISNGVAQYVRDRKVSGSWLDSRTGNASLCP